MPGLYASTWLDGGADYRKLAFCSTSPRLAESAEVRWRCALTRRGAFVIQIVSQNEPMVRRGSNFLLPGGSRKEIQGDMNTLKAYARTKDSLLSKTGSNPVDGGRTNRMKLFALVLMAISCGTFVSGCGGGGNAITLEVTPKTATLDEGEQLLFVATLGNDTKMQGVTWTLTGSGCAGTGCGTLSNVTTTSVTYTAPTGLTTGITASLEAAANAHMSTNLTATITIVLPVTFTTTTLPNGSNGVGYTQTLVTSGGVSPILFSLGTGSLPPGLTVNSAGTILGTPSSHGTFTFTVNATDNGGMIPHVVVASPTYSITISPPPPLSIPISTMPGGLVNTSYNASIVPAGPGGVPPYIWSIASGALPPGLSLSPSSGVVSGVPTTAGVYTFFPSVQDSAIPPQTATSATGVTITVSNVSPLQAVTPTLPTADVNVPYSGTLKATGGLQPYVWAITSGQLPSGLILNAQSGTITGTPILATTSNFTVQVKDANSNTAAQPLLITVAAGTATTTSLINGAYSFLFHGFDSGGNVVIAGNFTANGAGAINTGQLDSNRSGGTLGVFTGSTFTGTYTVGNDGRGTMQILVTNNKGAMATFNYLLVLYSSGSIGMIENDILANNPNQPQTHGSGIMKPVTGGTLSATDFNGNYAFELHGQDATNKPEVIEGVVHGDGQSILGPGTIDINDAGTYNSSLALSGNFAVSGSNSKGEMFLTFQLPSTAQVQLEYTFYFVSPTDIFAIAIDPTDATHPRLAGEMILQQPTASFTAAALNGTSVTSGTGLDGANSSVFAGLLTGNGTSAATLSYDQNDAGTVTSGNTASGTYVADPTANGRFAFSGLGSRITAAYLTGPNQGFLIGSDAAVTFGNLDAQTATASFTNASVMGGYTVGAPITLDPTTLNILGQWNSPNGSGTILGVLDEVDNNGTAHTDQSVAGTTYNITGATTGRGTMTTNSVLGLPTSLAFYVVSPSSIRAISTDSNPNNGHPLVFYLDH